MVPMTSRLMYQAEFLLSRGETIDVTFVWKGGSHLCTLTPRERYSDVEYCTLICKSNGKAAVVWFSEILLDDALAARLEAMAADADAIMLDRKHRIHVAKGRHFWAGMRKAS